MILFSINADFVIKDLVEFLSGKDASLGYENI